MASRHNAEARQTPGRVEASAGAVVGVPRAGGGAQDYLPLPKPSLPNRPGHRPSSIPQIVHDTHGTQPVILLTDMFAYAVGLYRRYLSVPRWWERFGIGDLPFSGQKQGVCDLLNYDGLENMQKYHYETNKLPNPSKNRASPQHFFFQV